MNLTFIELPPFERFRDENLTDEDYQELQKELLQNPEKGNVIQGLGGLRKLRIADGKSNKGKRTGNRAIYYYYQTESQIYLVTAYAKNEQTDLTNEQRKILLTMIEHIKTKL